MALPERLCPGCGASFRAEPYATKHAAAHPHYPVLCPVCTEAAASVPAEPASDDPWAGVIDREPGDPDMHHPDVPLAAAMLHGKQVTVHEPGEEPSTATFVADPGQYRMAAWLRREADRMIRLWRAGNLEIWSHPATTGGHAVVRIRDEEGGERYEEIRHQVYKALITAQKEAE